MKFAPKELSHKLENLGCVSYNRDVFMNFNTQDFIDRSSRAEENRSIVFGRMGICAHCGGEVKIRNPTMKCDHLYFPDNCEVCKANEVKKFSHLSKLLQFKSEEAFWTYIEEAIKVPDETNIFEPDFLDAP